MKLKKFTVTSLNNYIKVSLESDILLSNVNIEGEVSNLKYHTNGNMYFSLKDNECKINCVMFSRYIDDLNFEIEDGEKVEIVGKLSVYNKEGTYQLICYIIEKQGIGELYKQFEALKKSLGEKGYFDECNKKPIPKICFNIGVITSLTGAVIKDILNVHKRKNNFANIKIFNSLVQGNEAYKDIIQGIRYFNIENNVDVIIIARGGGSLEDLWVFNNEILAEEIYKSNIPIISGVGHETDFTICDFVSDCRASTPTAAAEICMNDFETIIFTLDEYRNKLDSYFKNYINVLKNRIYEITYINSGLILNLLKQKIDFINIMRIQLDFIVRDIISKNKDKINDLKVKLESSNLNKIFTRGFALVQNKNLDIIDSIQKISDYEKIILTFKDGKVEGTFKKEGVD